MGSDLERIEGWITPLIKQLSPVERRNLARKLASGLRRRQGARIRAQKNPDGSAFARRKRLSKRRGGGVKRRAEMFMKLRSNRYLRTAISNDGIAIGYNGVAAEIAQTHQEGLIDTVNKQGTLFKYPQRRLLGLTADDELWLIEQVESHLIK